MSKVKLIIKLNEQESIIEGIKSKDTIIYKENDILVKIKYKNNIYITRENDEYKIELNFENNECLYLLKKYNKNMNLEIKTKKINIDNNKIEIEYSIYEENYKKVNGKKPIKVCIPVNLKKYFPSKTLSNFFSYITL